jgi:hypothetical protein
MIDTLRVFEFQVEHQHKDGSWSTLDEDLSHHGVAANDTERGWVDRIFKCSTCPEVMRFRPRGAPNRHPPGTE